MPVAPDRNNLLDLLYDATADYYDAKTICNEYSMNLFGHQLDAVLDANVGNFAWFERGTDTLLIVKSRDYYKVIIWNNRCPKAAMSHAATRRSILLPSPRPSQPDEPQLPPG